MNPISQLPSPISRSAGALRMLIRNDEALVEHLAEQLRGEDGVVDALPLPGQYSDERARTLRKLGDRIRILQRRRAALAALSPISETPSPLPGDGPDKHRAGSSQQRCISNGAAALPGEIS